MKGFKVLTQKTLAFSGWKVGEWHREEGDLKIDEGNFFYDTLENCVYVYFVENVAHIYKCETGGEVIHGDPQTHPGQHVARELLLTEEVSETEIKAYFKSNAEKMITHKDWMVRAMAARFGLGLDKLVNDTKPLVRAEVVKQGYGLEKLVNDPDAGVREKVAEQGYGLDKLIDDTIWLVRAAVARQGYGLDKLINDEHMLVRDIAKEKLAKTEKANSDPIEEIFNKYCKDLTAEQKELARKCTEPFLNKNMELYEIALQSFVESLGK